IRRRPPKSPLFPYTTLFRSSCTPRKLAGARAAVRFARPGLGTDLMSASRRARLAFVGALVREQMTALAAPPLAPQKDLSRLIRRDRKSTRLNSSHDQISYAV